MKRIRGWLLLLSMLAVGGAGAADLRVVGLFKDRAVVIIDGKQRMLKVGKPSPEGVELISAYSEEAVLEFEGERHTFKLDSRSGGILRDRAPAEVRIAAQGGQYFQNGRINGHSVRFVVDTGASVVVINSHHAKRLGIDYRKVGRKIQVATASAMTHGYQVRLNQVELGGIRQRNVEGVVMEGGSPPVVLLGMSFLSKLEMTQKNSLMVLRVR